MELSWPAPWVAVGIPDPEWDGPGRKGPVRNFVYHGETREDATRSAWGKDSVPDDWWGLFNSGYRWLLYKRQPDGSYVDAVPGQRRARYSENGRRNGGSPPPQRWSRTAKRLPLHRAPERFQAKRVSWNGRVLGTVVGDTIQKAMGLADDQDKWAKEKATFVVVSGEWTSDGTHWGLGRGRTVAVKEKGRWRRWNGRAGHRTPRPNPFGRPLDQHDLRRISDALALADDENHVFDLSPLELMAGGPGAGSLRMPTVREVAEQIAHSSGRGPVEAWEEWVRQVVNRKGNRGAARENPRAPDLVPDRKPHGGQILTGDHALHGWLQFQQESDRARFGADHDAIKRAAATQTKQQLEGFLRSLGKIPFKRRADLVTQVSNAQMDLWWPIVEQRPWPKSNPRRNGIPMGIATGFATGVAIVAATRVADRASPRRPNSDDSLRAMLRSFDRGSADEWGRVIEAARRRGMRISGWTRSGVQLIVYSASQNPFGGVQVFVSEPGSTWREWIRQDRVLSLDLAHPSRANPLTKREAAEIMDDARKAGRVRDDWHVGNAVGRYATVAGFARDRKYRVAASRSVRSVQLAQPNPLPAFALLPTVISGAAGGAGMTFGAETYKSGKRALLGKGHKTHRKKNPLTPVEAERILGSVRVARSGVEDFAGSVLPHLEDAEVAIRDLTRGRRRPNAPWSPCDVCRRIAPERSMVMWLSAAGEWPAQFMHAECSRTKRAGQLREAARLSPRDSRRFVNLRRRNFAIASALVEGLASGVGVGVALPIVGRALERQAASQAVSARKANHPGAFIFAIGNRPGSQPRRQTPRRANEASTYKIKLPADRVLGTMPLEEARRRWPNIGIDAQVAAFEDFNRGASPSPEVILYDDGRREVGADWIGAKAPEVVYGGVGGHAPGSFKNSGGVVGGDESEQTTWVHESPNQYLVGHAELDQRGRPVSRDFYLIGDMVAKNGYLHR